MKKCFLLLTFIVMLLVTPVTSNAAVFDPLEDLDTPVTEVTKPNLSNIQTMPGKTTVEPEVTEVTEEEEDFVQAKKERTIRRKSKSLLDAFLYGLGVILALCGLFCTFLMIMAWAWPAVFDRWFFYLTGITVFKTPKIPYFITCILVSVVGALLFLGVFEDLMLKFYGWLIYKFT